MPATAVLAGLLLIVSFSMSHSVVEAQDMDGVEPVLVHVDWHRDAYRDGRIYPVQVPSRSR